MFTVHKGLLGYENQRGFLFKIPHPDISTSGYYFGENPVYGRHELVMAGGEKPQYYAVDNTIPSSGGVPKYDTRSEIYQVKREDFTKKFIGS